MKRLLLSVGVLCASLFSLAQGGGNGPVNGFTGYEYEFDYASGANYCSDMWNIFEANPISVASGGSTTSQVEVTFDGTQTPYQTVANRFHTDCSSINTLDFSGPGDNIVKARVSVSQNVQLGIFIAVDYNSSFHYADGTGFDLVSVTSGGFQEIEFTVPSTDWQGNNLDLSEVVGWGVGVRDSSDPDAAPTGSVTVTIDWIQAGSAASGNTNDSENERTPSGNGYEFNFSGNASANCEGSMIPPVFFGGERVGYTMSSTFDGYMTLSTDGTQLGGGAWQATFHDKSNCSNQTIDLSNTSHRLIEMRVRSSVDVPEVLCLVYDDQFILADKNADVKSLVANEWTTLTFDLGTLENSGGTPFDVTSVEWVRMTFRNAWDDNQGGAISSVVGTYEIDYIKIGDAVDVSCNEAPLVTTQPQNTDLCAGDNLTLTCGASGMGTIAYAWKKVGSGATLSATSTLTISNVDASDAGVYYCEITNECGTVSTGNASVTVGELSIVAESISNVTGCEGEEVAFLFQAGESGATYQWYKNGSPIAGAVDASYTFSAGSGDGGTYYSIATVDGCSEQSSSATVTISSAPSQPSIVQTQNVLSATGSSGQFYVWMQDCELVSWTQSNLEIQGEGAFQVMTIGSNGCASDPSDIFNASISNIAEKELEYFNVFPNPSEGQFEISSSFIPESIKIANADGLTVYENGDVSAFERVDLSALQAGVYFIIVDFGAEVVTKKVVLQ